VAIGIDGKCVFEKSLSENFRHSAQLAPMIIDAMLNAGLDKASLSAIAVSHGPGSYTGLRVGASTAKGFAYSLGIPIIAIPTLKSLAFGIRNEIDSADCIMPTIDARRMEVYTSVYSNTLELIQPAQALVITKQSLEEISSGCHHLVICGNGASKCKDAITAMEHIRILPSKCDASNLCYLAHEKLEIGDIEDLSGYVPFYLKQPNITKPKKPF
jgi:tRNA threonylcarbamoyladenosine biosynthesis protein TsaB